MIRLLAIMTFFLVHVISLEALRSLSKAVNICESDDVVASSISSPVLTPLLLLYQLNSTKQKKKLTTTKYYPLPDLPQTSFHLRRITQDVQPYNDYVQQVRLLDRPYW